MIIAALDILNELEKYHQSAQKQINFVFEKILDNIPKEIMHMPYQKCKGMVIKKKQKLLKGVDLCLI